MLRRMGRAAGDALVMTNIAAISQRIWDMKYRLKGPDGAPVDRTIDDTWRRVAKALAAVEREPAAWEARFFDAMRDFRFMPAGRILAGAGAARNVTLFNCFVMGEIPDDMAGIFRHLQEAALTMQQGGGIGYDFSTLRPRGAPVRGVGADASGPLSFMDVWDSMCRTIMSAGHRRGAMMATMRCDHPDIEAFIEAKREPGRLRMFNLSVLVTDAFMEAVKRDDPWDLVFGGTVYRTVQARALWDAVMRSTYAWAEPGVIFIDRINRQNPLSYAETIHATNPCVTADTWVHTRDGPRQVRDLVGRRFRARVDGRDVETGPSGFFPTGCKPVLAVRTREGHCLRLTVDHRVLTAGSRTRYRIGKEWKPAGDLATGDMIVLHDHRAAPAWPGPYSQEQGYLIGLLVGDGTLKADKAVLSVWKRRAAGNGDAAPTSRTGDGADGVMAAALAAAKTLPHRADFAGWSPVPGRGEHRLSLAAVKALALDLGMAPGSKVLTPKIEAASSGFATGFLRGFFDADASVQGAQEKGVSIRLAQSDPERLRVVQRMLARLGIMATIYTDRRPEQMRSMPDGRGGRKMYRTGAQHELVIANENVGRYAETIGFADTEKRAKLEFALGNYRRRPNRERFLAVVDTVEPDGEEEVFDVRVPGVNAFDANGLYVHNCGEQPLPPYGACLLGSINLARLVERPFDPDAALDLEELRALTAVAVRMMDNVTDISNFPLEAQREEALAKRRIGLGVTGLADALIMCRARYGGAEAVRLAEQWLAAIRKAAWLASAGLAAEKGPFPLFDAEKYLATPALAEADEEVRGAIRAKGLRNALLTSIAPTGTISLLADNVSSGIEPVFTWSYTRNVLMPDGARREEEVADYAWRLYRRLKGADAPLPDWFVDAGDLSPRDHVVMQAAVQKYVDSSISKTINCPEDIGFESFRDVYALAFEMGCKGCTTYRPNDVTGAVLTAGKGAKPADAAQQELPLAPPQKPAAAKPRDDLDAGVVYMTKPLDRPEALPGQTYKIRWPESDHAIYITLNDVVQDGRRRPFEIFINSKNTEHYAWTVGLTRMISAVFRRGGDVSFVVEELKAVFDPRGGQWVGRRYVPSLLAAIGDVIEQHMIDIGFLPDPQEAREGRRELKVVGGTDAVASGSAVAGGQAVAATAGGPGPGSAGPAMRGCPKCGQRALIRQEGCDICTSCTYSKCG